MSAQLGRENVHDLTPEEVARGLAEGTVLLVDVREPNETEIERYPQAFYLPMSEFDPAAIPDPARRRHQSLEGGRFADRELSAPRQSASRFAAEPVQERLSHFFIRWS